MSSNSNWSSIISRELTREKRHDAYNYDNVKGWRRFRPLRPGWGMYHVVRRRLPYSKSDITDGFTYRTVASIIGMYFVKHSSSLLPALAYTLDMYRRTGEFFGFNEASVSMRLHSYPLLWRWCLVFWVRNPLPLLALLFMRRTAIWAAIFHCLAPISNTCDYMRYVTEFSSESFGMYVGITYIIKGIEELVGEFSSRGSTDGYLRCTVAILYFASIYALEKLGSSTIFKPSFRGFLADYAYPVRILNLLGWLRAYTRPFESRAFYPTQPRSWLMNFLELDVKWIFVALPFGFLTMVLLYYDHNVSSLTAQSRQFPLKKPGGFRWDFFLLGCTTFLAGIFGLPMPNRLVPQAPVHTDFLTIYNTDMVVISTSDGEAAEVRRPDVKATAVVEQRASHFFMGLALIGTMTGPLVIVLHTMPAAVFAGAFFVVGVSCGSRTGFTERIVFLSKENRFIQREEPMLAVRRRKIALYVAVQLFGVFSCVVISQIIGQRFFFPLATGSFCPPPLTLIAYYKRFPWLICLLIPLRVVLLPKWFTLTELEVMDDLTANNKAVLASLGGAPILPEGAEIKD
ncbi:hypothetical protein AJ78_02183 [Emergomyces pasteurianus Ep9510]|uniref:Bicarbonate transporter-like transmembrane domain-containing protein n=1 Tax=Emergomyces pasteurianus Ep9510 TaxID=1447872 RepID=A0A1J9PNP5_9EURO|nr:hypothetical protein AJ78_02183 [Emergomyces pasteurianus Ep9510]